jgi:hypothetical protein
MKYLSLAAIVLMTAGHLIAADIGGRWDGIMESSSASGHVHLTLYQDGEKVTGTVSYGDAERAAPLEKLTIQDDLLTFEVHDNPNRVVTFKLKITDSALTGEAATGEKTAKVTFSRL